MKLSNLEIAILDTNPKTREAIRKQNHSRLGLNPEESWCLNLLTRKGSRMPRGLRKSKRALCKAKVRNSEIDTTEYKKP